MRNINAIALRKIADKYALDEDALRAYVQQGIGRNAFHISVCIAQHFELGPVWEQIRQIIHESENTTGVLP